MSLDSLLLCLCRAQLLPASLVRNVSIRCAIAAACRQRLIQQNGRAIAPTAGGVFQYLDSERDGPHVVRFLLEKFAVASSTNIEIYVHDRFGDETSDPERGRVAVQVHVGKGYADAVALHLFNHTSERGVGYHFDSLFQRPPYAQSRSRGVVCETSEVRNDSKQLPCLPAGWVAWPCETNSAFASLLDGFY